MKFADSHIHLFRGGFPGRYGSFFPAGDLAMYERIRGAHDIGPALVVGYEGEAWSRGNNRYIAGLAKTRPWIVPLAFHDAARPLTRKSLMSQWKQGFAGLSLYVFNKEETLELLEASVEVVGCLNEQRAILSFNCSPTTAIRLRPLFERLNETRILFSHLGLPGKMAGAAKRLGPVLELAALSHLGVKVSAAYACNQYPHPGLKELLAELRGTYGESRLYWGSDFSPVLDFASFAQAIDLGQPAGFLNRKIYADNLRKIIDRVRRPIPRHA